jgi:hypothetical protein
MSVYQDSEFLLIHSFNYLFVYIENQKFELNDF